MKSNLYFAKISGISNIVLFLLPVFLIAQPNSLTKVDQYSFYDDNSAIYPEVDYSRIYIVFNEVDNNNARSTLESEFPEIIPYKDKNASFKSNNSLSYKLNLKSSKEAISTLNKLRKKECIQSAYPYFILNNEVATTDNSLLISVDTKHSNTDQLQSILSNFKVKEKINLGSTTTFVLDIPSEENVFKLAKQLYNYDVVLSAQPNFIFKGKTHFDPNDPYYTSQWFLSQSNDADIDADQAWDITTGSSGIAVAVIDGNGYDLSHSEMTGKFVEPYNAVDDNNNPTATHVDENHGTPCAGLIGALTNNGYGVASVGYNTKVIPIRIGYDFNGGNFTTNSYTIQRAGQHIVNSSYSVVAVSNSIGLGTWANIDMVRNAYESIRTEPRSGKGAVVLASTGNDDQSGKVQYPCFFANVVGVGASNSTDQRAYFSNYGDSCDLVAPGRDLWTIDRTGTSGYDTGDFYEFSGTSAACPVTAGIVALMGSVFPNYTERQLRVKLYSTCEKVGAYSYGSNPYYHFGTWNNEMGYGRVNAYLSLQGGSSLDPPTNLSASVNGNDVSLTWQAPGGGGTTEELIYDNNVTTGSYSYEGYTMATHMSPAEACKILNISFYTTIEPGDNTFDAKIFNWTGSQPGTTVQYERTCTAVDNDWFVLDVSGFNLNFTGDFVVGFGSINGTTFLGYDANLNNGRSWDFNESSSTWSSWNEAYLIRAEVEYNDGSREILKAIPEVEKAITFANTKKTQLSSPFAIQCAPIQNQSANLRGFNGYNIYRNGAKINSSLVTNTSYNDNDLPEGTYDYVVTAVYVEGESDPSNQEQATISGGLEPPTDLIASNNANLVSLTWTGPGGGGNEEWFSYNDGTFENSFASVDGGYGLAQLFTIPTYPLQVKQLRFYTTSYQNYDNDLEVYILSGDGTAILYGPEIVQGKANDWIYIDIPSLVVNQASIIMATINTDAGGPFVGADDSFYDGSLYYGNPYEGFNELGELGDYEYVGSHEILIEYSTKDGKAQTETLSAKSAPGQSREKLGFIHYKVYRNGSLLTTTSNNYLSDNLSASGTYSYTVTALYDEGESSAAGPASVTWQSGPGIDENELSTNTILYPNPGRGTFILESPETIMQVEVFNYNGVWVYSQEVNNSIVSLNLNSLEAGVYFVYFNTENQRGVKKLVIK